MLGLDSFAHETPLSIKASGNSVAQMLSQSQAGEDNHDNELVAQTILGSFLAGLLHIETVLLKYCPANSKDLHDLVLRDFVGDTQLTNEEIQQHLPDVLSENWYG